MRNKAVILVVLLAAFLCIASFSSVASAQVWQEYYVLGDEATSLLYAYENMSYGEPGGHVNGTVSIVAWEPVNVTVDKDEDGYGDIDNFAILDTGEIWTLDTSDLGGDYISANGSISIVRTAWWFNATAGLGWPGTFVAGTWEVYPTESWGTEYVVPIDTPYTQLIVQAKEGNTDVTVNGIGPVTLNRGEDYHFANVPALTKITATKPIQVGILTNKNLGTGYGWDTRYFTLTPKELLGNDYYIPVPSFETNYSSSGAIHGTTYVPTNLTIYAFNDSTWIWIETAGVTTSLTLNEGDTYIYKMPEVPGVYMTEGDPALNGGYAAHIYADDTIWVLGSCDDNDDDYDWGFAGVNTSMLGAEYYIPWSPANPAYVTPVADATFHVDLDADGAEEYNFTLDRLNMSTIYPSSTDWKVAALHLTGARIWTNDDVPFAIMWGQDNSEDTPGERPTLNDPDNDFGYTVLYVPVYEAPEPGTVDGYVYEDRNCNCTYDSPDEPGVGNVMVELVNATGEVNTTTTNVSGYYDFTDVTAGDYTVGYNVSDLPVHLSPKCDDDSPVDSGIPAINTSISFNVTEGGTHRHNFGVNSSANISIVKLVNEEKQITANLGETVTFTLNVTNTGKVNITNLTVIDVLPINLTWANDANITEDSVTENPVDGTTTIVWENNLTVYHPFEPGESFEITFNATVALSAIPGTLLNNSANVTGESDWNDVDDEDEASVRVKGPPSITAVDGYVYEDRDCNCIFDPINETGVANVTVDLVNTSSGLMENTTKTNSSGYYNFTNVTAGNYSVGYNVSDLPAHLSPKCDDPGDYANPTESDSFSVPPVHTHNFGVKSKADVDIYKLVDGVRTKMVLRNQTVTYTLKITNTGDVNLTNITVVDLLPADITWADAANPVQDSVTHNSNGTTTIVWKTNLSDLVPGNHTVIRFNATVNESAKCYVTYENWATVNATSDWGPAGPRRDHADVFLEPPEQVPVLTPFGIAALIGLLSLVAVLSISTGMKRKKV